MNREDFPMLKNKYIYFNNAATTFKPNVVLDVTKDFYLNHNSNLSRGIDSLSYYATNSFEEARKVVANFINADSDEIVFTRGTTDSINMIAKFLECNVSKDDEIIISIIEHHSNFVPWQKICERKNAKLIVLNIDNNGLIDLDELKENINNKTKIVALNHVSNTFGGKNNLKEIANIVHQYDALFVVDGAQGIINDVIDVKDTNIDFYTFSGHKLYGPMGVGVLYGKKEILEKLEPTTYGGEMIDSVSIEKTTYKNSPYKFEAGTMMIPQVIGLATSIKYINSIGLTNIHNHIKELRQYLIIRLKEIDNIIIYNENNIDSSIVLFNIRGIHSHDIGSLLDKYNIIVRSGHHCAEPLMKYLNVDATLRVSLGLYNSKKEIDKLIEILMKAEDFINELF